MSARSNTEVGRFLAITAVGLLAAGLLPWIAPNQFYIHIGNVACLNLMFVLGLAIIARVGQLSMGHAGFALIGGYVGPPCDESRLVANLGRAGCGSCQRRARRNSRLDHPAPARGYSCWSRFHSAISWCCWRST